MPIAAASMSFVWVHAAYASMSAGRLSDWHKSVARLAEATPVNLQVREHNAYVMGVRHGFVTGLFAAMVLAAIAVLIYVTAGGA